MRSYSQPRSAVRRLALARLISITGGAAAFAALNFTVYERTGSAAWLSASLLLTFGVSGVFAPLGGMLGDRFDRKRVMIVSDLAGAGCFLALAFVHEPALLLALGFVAAVVEAPFWSASAAAIPNLVGKDDLAWANGLLQIGGNAGIMLGPALGGVLLAAIGPGMVFGLNAFSFVVSAAIIATVRGRFAEDRSEHDDEHRGFRAGFVFIARDRVLRTIVLAWVALVFGIGLAMVADVPLAELFGSGSTGYGLMIGAFGAGSVIGSIAGRKMHERNEARALIIGTIVMGATTAGIALSPWFPPILALLVLCGAADAVIMIADRSIQQRRTPDAVRSRVVGRVGGDDRHRVVDRVRPGRARGRGARPEGRVRDRRRVRAARRRGAGARAARLEARERGRGGRRGRGRGRAGSHRGGRARRRSGRRLDGGRGAVDTQPVTAPRSAVRRLATARLISITGGAAAYAALNFTIFEKTGSASWVAVSLLLTFGVLGFIGPPAGILGDRFDRRKVMIASELAGAVCFGMMALSSEPAWLLTWAFLSAVAEAPFFSASEAAIPNVAGPELTTWANSLVSASRLSGIAVGPALGGALLAVSNNPDLVFGVNAVSFVLSALVIWSVRARFSGERGEEEFGGLRAGFRFLRHDRVLRTLLFAWVVFISGMGMSMVADAPLAAVFDAGSFGFGLLITAWGGGSAIGSLIAKRMREGSEGTWLVRAGIVIAATGIGIGISPWFGLALGLMFVMGLADGTTIVAETNLRQRRAPDAVRSRVSAAFMGVMHVMLAFSYVVAAFVVPWLGPKPTYLIGGTTAGLAVLVLMRMRRYLELDEAARLEEAAG